MQADKWLEVNLVGLVILGGLTFVTTKVMNLNSAVADVQANLAATSDRVEHLAQALPALAMRVAQQQVTRPLRTVVVVSLPERIDGRYRANISVIDTQTSQRWVAPIALGGATDVAPLAALAWSGYELDPQFASFARMLDYARTASLDTGLPHQLDAAVSFVLGTTSAADFIAAAGHLGVTPRPAPFELKLTDWKSLSDALKTHPADFLADQPRLTGSSPATPHHGAVSGRAGGAGQ